MKHGILKTAGIAALIAFVVLIHLYGAQFGNFLPFLVERQVPGFIRDSSWLTVVSNPESYDAYSAYSVLERRESDVAIPIAREHIRSQDPYLWLNAATYLGSRGDVAAIPYLIKGLRHKASKSVDRRAAMLSKLTGESFGIDFQKWRDWYRQTDDPIQLNWNSSLNRKVADSWNPASEEASVGDNEKPAHAQPTTIPRKPNILFIFSDDHAIPAISAYDTPARPALLETPNLDRLAGEGIIFDRSYCGNSICGPSRATILTGLHSHANGMLDNFTTFDGSQQTFPKLLQDAGYHTAIRGKWHLRSEPTGFDTWMVYPGQGQYYNPVYRTPDGRKQLPGYSVDTTADLGIEYLRERAEKADEPFFLAIQFKAPHRPFLPPLRHLDAFSHVKIPEPPTLFPDFEERSSAFRNQTMTIKDHLDLRKDLKVPDSEGQWGYWVNWFEKEDADVLAQYKAHYAKRRASLDKKSPNGNDLVRWKWRMYLEDILGAAKAVDDNVGRLLDTLDELGLAENTLVVYSSDQGFYLGEHGWYDKRWMLEESYRMPLMMRWKGTIPEGQRSEALVQNIDYAPTFLNLAGISAPEAMHGASLLPLMVGQPPTDWRESLYYFYYEYPKWHAVQPHYGVSDARYKLIHFYLLDDWELIDLKKDPLEQENFIGDPAYKEVRDHLYEELLRLREQYDFPEKLPNPDNRHNKSVPAGDLPKLPNSFPG